MLQDLFRAAREQSELRSSSVSSSQLENQISELGPVRSAAAALAKCNRTRLIAEIKRRSPSKGFLAEIPDVSKQAKLYSSAGADAISVLTESSGFGGSLQDLIDVSASVDIPVLRKDFISTDYQLLEARASGADFVLLIVAGLEKPKFLELYRRAQEFGLEVLVETHSAAEIAISNDVGANIVGINTRDLTTFKTDIGLFEQLAGLLDPQAIAIAESSVKDVMDVVRYRNAGADGVLVGEALVTGDPAKLIPEFISVR